MHEMLTGQVDQRATKTTKQVDDFSWAPNLKKNILIKNLDKDTPTKHYEGCEKSEVF